MKEEWKQIEIDGEKWGYEVSNLGNVRNMKTDKLLNLTKHSNGYIRITLSKNRKTKKFYVHRLVATMFIPNTDGLKEVNHIDFNRENNSVENLEWVSHKDNVQHSFNGDEERGKQHKQKISDAKKKKIRCVENGMVFDSLKDASEWCNGDVGSISSCCQGKRYKTVSGYHWEYIQ